MDIKDESINQKIDQAIPDIKVKKEDLPQVKHERLPGTKVDMFKIEDSKGKPYDARQETFTEKEIPNTHLTQIAPLFYYCTDNNKILMIPVSIQFTTYEFLQLAAKMSGGLENIVKEMEEKSNKEKPSESIKVADKKND
jgi:hypothetical protein